jgi:hypothetical protein
MEDLRNRLKEDLYLLQSFRPDDISQIVFIVLKGWWSSLLAWVTGESVVVPGAMTMVRFFFPTGR